MQATYGDKRVDGVSVRVLLVDDDADLVDLLSYALRRDGYAVTVAVDGLQALRRWEEEPPDIMLIDVGLPKLDGFEVCRRIRHESPIPIIMLTAADSDDDVVRGLRLGADDYVTKPFSARQLIARIKAVTRRYSSTPAHQVERQLQMGNLVLDLEAHQVAKDGQGIQLTRLEFRIFYMLVLNAGRVIPYSRLVEYAWGYEGGDSSLLKTHICHIREKLGLSAGRNGGIRAVPSIGYSLAVA